MKIKSRLLYLPVLSLAALSIVWAWVGQVREPADSTPVLTVGSANVTPGGLTEIPVHARNLAGRNASALQFDLYVDIRWAEVLETKAGDAAIRANKQVASNRLPTESRVMSRKSPAAALPGRNSSPELVPALRQRIIVAGMDNTPMGDGIVAYVVLRMRDVVPEGQFQIEIDRSVISDANARPVPVRQESGWVTSRGSRLPK